MAKPPPDAAWIRARRCTHGEGRHVVVELLGEDGAVIADAHLEPAIALDFAARLTDTIEAASRAGRAPLH